MTLPGLGPVVKALKLAPDAEFYKGPEYILQLGILNIPAPLFYSLHHILIQVETVAPRIDNKASRVWTKIIQGATDVNSIVRNRLPDLIPESAEREKAGQVHIPVTHCPKVQASPPSQ